MQKGVEEKPRKIAKTLCVTTRNLLVDCVANWTGWGGCLSRMSWASRGGGRACLEVLPEESPAGLPCPALPSPAPPPLTPALTFLPSSVIPGSLHPAARTPRAQRCLSDCWALLSRGPSAGPASLHLRVDSDIERWLCSWPCLGISSEMGAVLALARARLCYTVSSKNNY